MVSNPKVSILMITYNHEKFISEAISSVLMQKFSYDYEIIIGEDNSPDNTKSILREYEKNHPEKIKVFYREKNIGATNNLYDIILKARGQYLVFLEGDDYWTDDNKLQKQVDFLENNSMYIGCFHIIDDIIDDIVIRTYPSKINLMLPQINVINNPGELINIIRKSSFVGTIHMNSIMIRNQINFKDESIEWFMKDSKLIGDIQLFVIILSYGKMALIRENMGVHRRVVEKNGTSFSSQKIDFVYEDYSKILKNIYYFLDGKYSNELKKIIKEYDMSTIIKSILNRNFSLAKRIFIKLRFSSKLELFFYAIKKITLKFCVNKQS